MAAVEKPERSSGELDTLRDIARNTRHIAKALAELSALLAALVKAQQKS